MCLEVAIIFSRRLASNRNSGRVAAGSVARSTADRPVCCTIPRREFEADLGLVVHDEGSCERPALAGDELIEHIGPAGREKFSRLAPVNGLVKNDLSEAELA